MSLDTGNSTTTIELSNILKSDQSNLQNEDLSNNPAQSATHKNKRAITKKKPFECGVSKFGSTQSLTTGGEEVARGEWPWYVYKSQNDSIIYLFTYRLVAFYGLQRGKTQFICGANLISKRLVITAGEIK